MSVLKITTTLLLNYIVFNTFKKIKHRTNKTKNSIYTKHQFKFQDMISSYLYD